MPVRPDKTRLAAAICLLILPACGPEAADRTAAVAAEINVSLPGAPSMPAAAAAKIRQAWLGRAKDYRPRTRHLEPDGRPKYSNRLLLETSPYLRQHAHNPVNWFPWGDEAFRLARELGRPVLLSVGYSTCHWCHVMEEESFDDVEIATFLNENYIAIKVDREERPDVDSIYMSAVQSLTGRGGWPMTVWLTADRQPFYGGTYFPARDGDRGARVGFLTLLQRLKQVYDRQPAQVAQQAAQIVDALRNELTPAPGELPGSDVIERTVKLFQRRFDTQNGGVSGEPKFPSTFPIRLMLRYHRRAGDARALEQAAFTLEQMARGGMYDQVGGGFHRYSTDRRWLVPHFEKMLYDNALLTLAYLEGWQLTGREEFARVVRDILRYVERDMTSPDGAFYSATDADSLNPEGHREEGWFFTWTPAEIESVIGKQRARLVNAYYGVTAEGNFEGRSILNRPQTDAEAARELGVPVDKLRTTIDGAREDLYRARKQRPAPLRDEKILAAWNGLMISAFARAGLVLGEERYVERAAAAARFVLAKMRERGRLKRSFMDGQARHNAYLDDYAFLIGALLDLYEATSNSHWLREAIALDRVLHAHYEDRDNGGLFLTSDDHESLLAREKPAYDGAIPSGNSVHALNLLRLAEFTSGDDYRRRAEATLTGLGGVLSRSPGALTEMTLALDFKLDRPKEVILVTPAARRDAEPLLARMRTVFLPNRILVVAVEGDDLETQQELVPLLAGKRALKKRPTAYVCEQGICKLPTSDPAVFAEQLSQVEPLKPQRKTAAPPPSGG